MSKSRMNARGAGGRRTPQGGDPARAVPEDSSRIRPAPTRRRSWAGAGLQTHSSGSRAKATSTFLCSALMACSLHSLSHTLKLWLLHVLAGLNSFGRGPRLMRCYTCCTRAFPLARASEQRRLLTPT